MTQLIALINNINEINNINITNVNDIKVNIGIDSSINNIINTNTVINILPHW